MLSAHCAPRLRKPCRGPEHLAAGVQLTAARGTVENNESGEVRPN